MRKHAICGCWRKPGIRDPESEIEGGQPGNPWTMQLCAEHGKSELTRIIREAAAAGAEISALGCVADGGIRGVRVSIEMPAIGGLDDLAQSVEAFAPLGVFEIIDVIELVLEVGEAEGDSFGVAL